jgi:endonuclease YncB( thermonuclease family)
MLTCLGLIVLVIVRLDENAAERIVGTATIIDGDSLVLAGQKLRLEGIDAPEYNQVCRSSSKDYFCGKQARQFLSNLISQRAVQCNGWQRDKYARLLVRCHIASQTLNREMVVAGWAVSYGDYFAEEAAAREAKRGIWQGAFERPSQWRKMRGELSEVPHDFWLKIVSFFKSLFGV